MDPATGTFTTMDTYGGSLTDPMSLHKYLFANSNPVRYCDPSGFSVSLGEMVVAMGISAILSAVDSGISYYLKYKDSDTAKYGKTVFGWNVVTAASEGFFKGFFLGGIFYALCSVLLIRFILSVIGLCLGIQQGTYGLDEIISSDGNTAYGIYNLIMGSILICVSTYGIAKTGAEILNEYGDALENFSTAEEYSYQTEETNRKTGDADKHWNRRNTVGRTPGKNSATGRAVQERMRAEEKLRGYGDNMEFLSEQDGQWYPVSEADMSHVHDAVTWWNRLGRLYGPLSPQVRSWMKNPNVYCLEYFRYNRSDGARLAHQGVRYLPPPTI